MPTLISSLPIPPIPVASASGEAKVLLAFQSLPDDFRIYHRKTWYSFDGHEGVREGEADFLVLHPELGMLVLEVKGGGAEEHQGDRPEGRRAELRGAGHLPRLPRPEPARRGAQRAGVAWSEPPEDDRAATEAFWDETSGLLLLEAAQALGERFDALVVDEAQDFLTEWWGVLEALLKERAGAPVALVADPDQDLWRRGSVFPAGLPVFPLRTNCRSTSALRP